jgi:hypothetical protein
MTASDRHLTHSVRKLHDGSADRAVGDAADARTATVNRGDENVALGLLDREVVALRRGLVDRVENVDVRMSREKVFHRCLARLRVAHVER